MKNRFRDIGSILKKTAISWNEADPFRQSATISYYAIFSIPGLLIIIIWIAGLFYGDDVVRGEINTQISEMMGGETAKSLDGIVEESAVGDVSLLMKIVGIGALLFGATTLFFQMQKTLNYLWDVEAVPENNLKKFIVDRVSSLGLILVIAFLMLITLVLSSMIAVISDWISASFGDNIYFLLEGANFLVSFLIVAVLFALMFKVLPDVDIEWRSVWIGAFVTSLLFSIGKTLLGLYFGVADPSSSFGAAGTVILVMLWVNYTCLILFFGAEFTKEYARHYNHKIQPSKHAQWLPRYEMKKPADPTDPRAKH
jgi:membrane protein